MQRNVQLDFCKLLPRSAGLLRAPYVATGKEGGGGRERDHNNVLHFIFGLPILASVSLTCAGHVSVTLAIPV